MYKKFIPNSILCIAFFYSATCFCQANNAKTQVAKLRDPTQPLSSVPAGEQAKPIVLQAIFYGQGRKEAIVNGEIVKVGQRINGKKIVDIKPHSVSYKADGRVKVLKLRQSIFKK